ncbi:C40 family peptidase [Marnyiella aurantia]|uniref:C40 family peptidase n=1 Tax=Marnyiella aurantia TaxID=2758037 RepID=A0A7D7QEZ3_9FLAO|nr:C40 family peptidase [Marnyiella aurantia]MBA5245796.1 C40 family peptidase [Marnyiella aurantia]QMS98801.1 C40 family peptidase [Marnyiella aurantia]
MKQILSLLMAMAIIISCGTAKKPVKRPDPYVKPVTKAAELRSLMSKYNGKTTREVEELLKDAEKYLGAPYKYAGNTSSGFDCSGLVCKVFDENSMKLPRRSEDQGKEGKEVDISKVQPGDLLFFATSGGSRISHVGIVHRILNDGEINFIHSSTSKGVIISSLNEKYWNQAYLFARRVL